MLAIIVALLFALAPSNPESVEIPLSKVWGHDVEGTKPIASSVEPRLIGQDQFERLSRSMVATVHAGPAFVINGEPKQAIKSVLLVHEGVMQPKHTFTEGDLCLVVCAHGSYSEFHLDKIERGGHRIKVSWHLKRTGQEMPQWHLVLIPLSKCEPGDYDVEINRTGEPKFGPDWWVSKSTSFQVLKIEQPTRRPPGFAPNFSGAQSSRTRSPAPKMNS
jgi:hypothetical protein